MFLFQLSPTTYKRIDIFTDYESLIWTTRYAAYGEFELISTNNEKARLKFRLDSVWEISDTPVPMIVTSVNTKRDDSDRLVTTVKGRSLEWVLNSRVVLPNIGGLEYRTQHPVSVALYGLVRTICILSNPPYNGDTIPKLKVSNSTIPGDTGPLAIKPDTLYNTIKSLCDSESLGFSITSNFHNGNVDLFFNIYKGQETTNVIFSRDLGTLEGEESLEDREDFKNVAYVCSKDYKKVVVVYAPGHNTAANMARRLMLVVADDIDIEGLTELEIKKLYTQRGLEELAKNKRKVLVDGEADTSKYVFRKDYSLGSIVKFKDSYGVVRRARVTEHIWAHDVDGVKTFPTLEAIED